MRLFFIIIPVLYSLSAYTQNKTIDSLQKVLQTRKEDTSKVNLLNAFAYKFTNINPDAAIYFANAALALATKLNYEKGIANSKLEAGAGLANLGKTDEALKNLNEALLIYDQLLSSANTAGKSLIVQQRSSAYNFIGLTYIIKSSYSKALVNLFIALKIREETKDEIGVSYTENNIGVIYYYQANYPEALKHYFASLKIREELNDKAGACDSYVNIGVVYEAQGNYPEALKNHSAALKLAKEIGDREAIAGTYINFGSVYDKMGNYNEAVKYHFASIKIYGQIGDKRAIASAYYNIGVTYRKQKKYNEASLYLNKSLSLAREMGNLEQVKLDYNDLATLDSAQGNYKQALEHYKLFISYRDSLFNEENTKKLVQSQMQYDFDKKQDSIKAAQDKKDLLAVEEIKNQKTIRNFSVAGAVAVLSFGGFSFYRYRRRRRLQSKQEMLNERLRISRELHDEVGATLSSISIFSQAAIQKNESGNMADSKNILERIGETSREVMSELNDTVWLINPHNDNLQKIIQRISNYALPLCRTNDIHFEIEAAASVENLDLSVEKRKAIYLIIKEAVNNSLKYAGAKNLNIQFERNQKTLRISIKDDGCGFSESNLSAGNGLNNMKQRAKDVKGKIDFHSVQQGTELILQVPLTNIGD